MNTAVQAGLSQLLFLIGAAIIIAILLMRRHRRPLEQQYVRPKGEPTAGEKTSMASPSLAPGEVGRWEVHLHDLARDLSGQLDSKMAALGQLIREADRAASRLEAALGVTADGERTTASGADFGSSLGSPEVVPQADQAQNLKGDWPERLDQPAEGALATRLQRQRCCEEIYTLSDYGLEPTEVAQRVGSPVGEVELILGLRGTIRPAG